MKIIGLGGLSESGKSYSGSYLSKRHSIPRVKIVKYIEKFRVDYFKEEINLEDFHRYLYDTPNKFTEFFLEKMIQKLKDEYGSYPFIVVESLRDPFFGEYFKKVLKEDFIVIYLEARFEDRVEREAIKTGKDTSEISRLVYEKDITKVSQGALKYQELADYSIDNHSSIENLNLELDKIVTSIMDLTNK
ncbi:nucleoside/nucleotide kinase family protein [Granulicatella seriolae]|uniref:Dephospho-CoA kinase n=1 Tax=Granulicatella seriolae TaxID=2967226 RepID=A0ABT1WPU6_9LACT|nr:hypothetical protein [Granulicatella seriolae]